MVATASNTGQWMEEKELEQESGVRRMRVELPGWGGKNRVAVVIATGCRWAGDTSGLRGERDSPPDP